MASALTHKTVATRSAPHLLVLTLCAVFSFPPTALAADNRKTFSSFEIKVASRNGFFPKTSRSQASSGTQGDSDEMDPHRVSFEVAFGVLGVCFGPKLVLFMRK